MFTLLAGTTAAVAVLILFLVRWNCRESYQYSSSRATYSHSTYSRLGVLSSTITDKKQRELLDVISRNAKRLQRLAEDILDIARIESKSLKLDKTQFNLNEVVEDVIDEYRATVQENEGKRTVTFILRGSKRDIFVQADKHRITQVITNLLSNAVKFTINDNSSSMTVSVESKHNGGDDDNYALVKIKDTGDGIDPTIMPRLFTKFSTKSSHGTGMGLFICKSIIEAHGGKIWARNNYEEKGATFFFTLPVIITKVQASRGSLTSNR
jgi:signal transduction histidine kinase